MQSQPRGYYQVETEVGRDRSLNHCSGSTSFYVSLLLCRSSLYFCIHFTPLEEGSCRMRTLTTRRIYPAFSKLHKKRNLRRKAMIQLYKIDFLFNISYLTANGCICDRRNIFLNMNKQYIQATFCRKPPTTPAWRLSQWQQGHNSDRKMDTIHWYRSNTQVRVKGSRVAHRQQSRSVVSILTKLFLVFATLESSGPSLPS